MYKDHKDSGLEILAYPCNQFGSQEPWGSTSKPEPHKILDFVNDKYNVNFPMMEIVETAGKRQHPLYKWLREEALKGGDLTWNFEKFLVNGDGKIVGHWVASDEPNSFAPEVAKLLS